MKPTDTNIADFYGITRKTLHNYKKSKDNKMVLRYEALKKFFIEYHQGG